MGPKKGVFFFSFRCSFPVFLLFFGHNLLPKAHFGGFQGGGMGYGGYGVWARVIRCHELVYPVFFLLYLLFLATHHCVFLFYIFFVSTIQGI